MQVWFHEEADEKQSWARYARRRVCVGFSFELQALKSAGSSEAENRIEASEGMVLGGSAVVPRTGMVVAGALVTMETSVLKVNDSPQLPRDGRLECWSAMALRHQQHPDGWYNRVARYAQAGSRSINLADPTPTHSCPSQARSLRKRHQSGTLPLVEEALRSSYHVQDSTALASSTWLFLHVAAHHLLHQKTKHGMGNQNGSASW